MQHDADRRGCWRSPPLASFMVALDALVVTTALTTIRLDLGASIEELEWTVNAYNLSFAVLLMTAAALGDRFGRRRMFAAGLGAVRAWPRRPARSRPARLADRRAGRAGRRRGARHAAGAGAAERARSRPSGAAAALGHLQRRDRARRARRPGGRRRGHPGPRLAVDLLAQRADRRSSLDPARRCARMRESHGPRRARSTCPAWCWSPAARSGVVWGLVRGNAAGWGSAEVVGALARRRSRWSARSSAWELRAPRADAAAAAVPLARVLGRQRGDLPSRSRSLFGAVFFMAQFLQIAPATARSAPACGCCRGRRRCSSSRRSPARSSTASASGRSSSAGCCCRPSGWPGSR